MKFLCMGYYDEQSWATKSPEEIQALMDACFTYDLHLQETGRWLGGDALISGSVKTIPSFAVSRVIVGTS